MADPTKVEELIAAMKYTNPKQYNDIEAHAAAPCARLIRTVLGLNINSKYNDKTASIEFAFPEENTVMHLSLCMLEGEPKKFECMIPPSVGAEEETKIVGTAELLITFAAAYMISLKREHGIEIIQTRNHVGIAGHPSHYIGVVAYYRDMSDGALIA